MPGYMVTAVFEPGAGRPRAGRDILAAGWGHGHRFSFWDGRRLSVIAEVTAPDDPAARGFVLARTAGIWAGLGGDALPPPVSLQVQCLVSEVKTSPGAVGRGPDRFLAESAACVVARLRAARAALADLEHLG